MKNINLMKKILISLTASLSVMSASFCTANAEIADNSVVTGDINSDSKVDLTDLSELSLAIIGDKTLTESQIKAADIDENGKAELPDLARLRQYLSKVIDSLDIKSSIAETPQSVPTANPIDKTDYSKIERDPAAIESGFSGLKEATPEQIEASKNQPEKGAVPTANPIDNTDYSKIERDPAAIESGFSGALEATEEQIEASKNQPEKGAVPTANPIDKTDYSKIERDPAAIESGFSGALEATEEQMEASKNQPEK